MRKIAFIKRGSFSHINESVERVLSDQFPDFELEIIDMAEDFERWNPQIRRVNRWHVLRHYFWDIARRRRKTMRDCFYRTPYLFSAVKRYMQERIGARAAEYLCTFQTQSLYDASVPGLPHFVYTDHTNRANLYYPGADRRQLFAEAWLRLEGTIYKNATRSFTMSHHVRRSIIEQYGGDPRTVSCIYAGTNAMEEPVALDNGGYSNQCVLFVGRDWERKGGPGLAEAFRIVLRKHPRARLLIVGCSPRLDVPNCEIAGPLPLEEVRRYFSRASIFCMPSSVEPFGIVYIEALLSRLPVVASRIGALPDFIEEGVGGVLVEPGQVSGLAEALDILLSDPAKCRRFGEAGHEVVRARYNWESVGRKMKGEMMAALEF